MKEIMAAKLKENSEKIRNMITQDVGKKDVSSAEFEKKPAKEIEEEKE